MKSLKSTILIAFLTLVSGLVANAQNVVAVNYKKVEVDGYNIFYREAGSKSKPAIVLLHGFPSTSHMYRDLITDLADKYYVVAPDYIGMGQSDAPSVDRFNYSFENIASNTAKFIEKIGLTKYSLYLFDIGGPVGFRIAVNNPEKIQSIIVQNTTIYPEGADATVAKPVFDYTSNPNPETENGARAFFQLEVIKSLYVGWAANPETVSPDSYLLDYYYVSKPGADLILLSNLRDYKSNFDFFLKAQAYLKKYQPNLLVISGKRDKIFIESGNKYFLRDVPTAQISPIDAGHFLLEEKHEEAAKIIKTFLIKRSIK
ncbi:alpha/beta hydrolase [Flavobacterium sp.]|uniref:alpha/beta fold hydrolase n=1 Tax=Flavobacterium sp. TaxID=239 RepID=UPI002626D7DC|nr:alpha/beta hydrolase [Flavobacterium sp.]